MPLIERALTLFRELLNEVRNLTKAFRFNPGNDQHLLAVSLHGTVLEHAQGIMILLDQQNVTSALTLLRSLMDAAIDLFNFVDDESYEKYMRYKSLEEQKRILKLMKEKPENLYSAGFAAHPREVDNQSRKVEEELKKLKGEGIKALTTEGRFKRAKQPDLRAPYWSLCLHSHNNIIALKERHLCQTPDGDQVVCFLPPSDEDVILLLDTAAGLVANSITLLPQLPNNSSSLELKNIGLILGKIRTLWKNQSAPEAE